MHYRAFIVICRFIPAYHKGYEMNHITMHGSLTVAVDGARFNVRSLWQLYQLLRLLV